MLDRNRRIKSKPERFQDGSNKYDCVVTCEERVYDQVIEGRSYSSIPLSLKQYEIMFRHGYYNNI